MAVSQSFLIFEACSRQAKANMRAEKNQRTIGRDQRKNFKHKRKFSLSRSLSLGVNGPLGEGPHMTITHDAFDLTAQPNAHPPHHPPACPLEGTPTVSDI